MGTASRAELEAQALKARNEQKRPQPKYTVVVQLSPKSALRPGEVTMVFVVPTGNLTEPTFQEFRDAAEKGGCEIRMFTVGDSGIEGTKWELMTYGATRLD
jgi:hypothetical protein